MTFARFKPQPALALAWARFRGFSLIELMVAVTVAAILAAVAYPLFTQYVQKSRRSDAIEGLSAIVQAQERFRGNASTYSSTLSALGIDATSNGKHYTLSLEGIGAANSYTVGYVAVAKVKNSSPQIRDLTCATMTVTLQSGSLLYESKSSSDADSTTQCWPK